MKSIFFLVFFFPICAQAFTLNNNFEAAFADDEVKVSVDRNTNCPFAEMTVYELSDLVKPAVDKFWNTVPSSSLRLKSAGFTGPIDNINSNSGRLCPPTDDKCISDAGSNLIPPVKDIIIACNANPLNFGGNNVLAVTVPNNFNGKKIKGAVILINDDSSTGFNQLSRSDKISVIAHEIGHAIGLGHSKDKSALMYYRTVKLRKALGQDDVDGVSYLYPVHIDGCGAFGGIFGGTISTNKKNKSDFPLWPMVVSLVAMIGIFELVSTLRKPRPFLRLSSFLSLFRA
jgi:hypothetical protein